MRLLDQIVPALAGAVDGDRSTPAELGYVWRAREAVVAYG
jgi:hypothetical protein